MICLEKDGKLLFRTNNTKTVYQETQEKPLSLTGVT